MRAFGFSIMLALVTPVAIAADESYRSVMPDGSIRYGAAPEPGARQVKKLAAPPVSTGTLVVTSQEKNKAARLPAREGGGIVLPPSSRETPRSVPAGTLQAPGALPKRGGYE
jgi:hypothetical protein